MNSEGNSTALDRPATAGEAPELNRRLSMAMGSLDQADHMIHAAWMAARSLDGDALAEGEALQAVIHSAGEWLSDARAILRKAGVA